MDARSDERFDSDLKITLDQGEGVMRNVSASGLYFVTGVQLQPGERFTFMLEFPSLQSGVISARCEAHVVRVEPQAGALQGVGAAFEGIEFHRI